VGKGTFLPIMPRSLQEIFVNLGKSNYKITSPQTRSYNCVAFAAGKTDRWWWPASGAYWPRNAPLEETLEAFIAAFQTLGYSPCENGELEPAFEKVVIYTDKSNQPTHMARQLSSGMWASKCGMLEDIEHETLEVLESAYGQVRQYLKRPYSKAE
jgi:hypothetical protein